MPDISSSKHQYFIYVFRISFQKLHCIIPPIYSHAVHILITFRFLLKRHYLRVGPDYNEDVHIIFVLVADGRWLNEATRLLCAESWYQHLCLTSQNSQLSWNLLWGRWYIRVNRRRNVHTVRTSTQNKEFNFHIILITFITPNVSNFILIGFITSMWIHMFKTMYVASTIRTLDMLRTRTSVNWNSFGSSVDRSTLW